MTMLLSSSRDALAVGGRLITDVDNIVHLRANFNSGNLSVMKTVGGPIVSNAAGFSPTTGTHFVVMALEWSAGTVTTGTNFNVGYNDSDVGYDNTQGAATNLTTAGGNIEVGFFRMDASTTSGEHAMFFTVPTGKFPVAVGGTGNNDNIIFNIFGKIFNN